MITGRGSGSKTGKDNTQFLFWNGSRVGNLAAAESSRGQRRTGGTVEEVILVDKNALNEVIIPTMNVDRRLGDGTTDTKELINKSLTYITTAGYRDSFSYDKLKELFIQSVAEPENTIVLGNTYKVPIKEGLLNANFVQELKLQGTFSEDSFLREYCSVWSGSSEDAFFSSEAFDRARTLKNPDNAYDGRTTRGYYVLGVDVGRLNCTTEVIVIKVVPQKYGPDNKNVVNIYTFEDEHFEKQAANLKRLYYQYQAKIMVVDCNGIGAGLLDFLLKPTHDTDTGNEYPPFGVYNDDDGYYKKYRTPDMELDAVWVMKANLQLNTEMYTYCKVQLTSGRLNFLVDEVQAKNDLVQQIGTANKKYEYLQERLKPYILTTALKEQMCNLKETNDNNNIILKQVTRGIKKDKFSGLIYGLYFIHLEEEKRKKKRNRDISKLMLVN